MTKSKDGGFRYIIDEPAEKDFFNTHKPVATAITRSITANAELKILGLLGRWGSGKSTIARELEMQLDDVDKNFLVFTYDAWLHQHDPLRRSFLESLVDFLHRHEKIDRKYWKKKLKKLSGGIEKVDTYQTPIVTTEAKWFFLAAAAFTLGLSWLGRETFQDGMGDTVTMAGRGTLFLAVGLMFVAVFGWLGRFVWLSEKGKKPTLVPAMLFNKNVEHVNTLTRKPIDPSSIEFGKAFRKLMQQIKARSVRLVIIIDNIDRIDDKEAMQIWANARSFFLSARDDNQIGSEDYHPTVILPVDEKSLEQMFAIENDPKKGKQLARSFINKTFDVTFGVPAPVMSDWKRYLDDQMRECLGKAYSEVRMFRTRQLLEAWFKKSETPVTPREINKSLNRLVALLIQWEGKPIPYETIAYFSFNRDTISDDIEAEVLKESHPLARFTGDWAREIAALHYGVGLDVAGQVLMAGPIQNAIQRGDPSLAEPYRKITGFGDVLEAATNSLPLDAEKPGSSFEVITSAALILAADDGNEPWRAASWSNLIRELNDIETVDPSALSIGFRQRLLPFFEKVETSDTGEFIHTIEILLDHLASQNDMTVAQLDEIGALANDTIEFAKQQGIEPPVFNLRGDAGRYVRRLWGLRDFPQVQVRLKSNVASEEILADLVRRLTDEMEAPTVPTLVNLLSSSAAALMIGSPLEKLDGLVASAEGAARGYGGETNIFRSAIRLLAAPIDQVEDRHAVLGRLASEGIFSNQLNPVAAQDDAQAVAPMLAAMLWKEIDVWTPVRRQRQWHRFEVVI